MDSEELRGFFGNFVESEYVDLVDDKAQDYAWEYSERGGSPRICVALGLSETENLGWGLEEISRELDVSRKAVYNAREDLDLVEYESRGRHI